VYRAAISLRLSLQNTIYNIENELSNHADNLILNFKIQRKEKLTHKHPLINEILYDIVTTDWLLSEDEILYFVKCIEVLWRMQTVDANLNADQTGKISQLCRLLWYEKVFCLQLDEYDIDSCSQCIDAGNDDPPPVWRGFSSLRYWNKRIRFFSSHVQMLPITTQRFASFGQVDFIFMMRFVCWRKCAINSFIIVNSSPFMSLSYAWCITRLSWCRPHHVRYPLYCACCSSQVTTPCKCPVITLAPSEPTPMSFARQSKQTALRNIEMRLNIFSSVCRLNMAIAMAWILHRTPLRWKRI